MQFLFLVSPSTISLRQLYLLLLELVVVASADGAIMMDCAETEVRGDSY